MYYNFQETEILNYKSQNRILPAITTGIIDFIIRSGFITAIAAMPTPDLAVPYAAPNAEITV